VAQAAEAPGQDARELARDDGGAAGAQERNAGGPTPGTQLQGIGEQAPDRAPVDRAQMAVQCRAEPVVRGRLRPAQQPPVDPAQAQQVPRRVRVGERALADGVDVARLGRQPEARPGDEAPQVQIEVLGEAQAAVVSDTVPVEEVGTLA
jgi:hypothetical protein